MVTLKKYSTMLLLLLIVLSFIFFSLMTYKQSEKQVNKDFEFFSTAVSHSLWTIQPDAAKSVTQYLFRSIRSLISVKVYAPASFDNKDYELYASESRELSNFEKFLKISGLLRIKKLEKIIMYKDHEAGKAQFVYYNPGVYYILLIAGFHILGAIVALLQLNLLESNSKLSESFKKLESLNEELQEALKDLEEAQERVVNSEKMAAMGKLMANIAHDINTPAGIVYTSLTELKHNVENIKKSYNNGELTEEEFVQCVETTEQLLDITIKNITRISDLVKSLKRVSTSEMVDVETTFDLSEFIKDVLKTLHPKIRKTKLDLVLELPQKLIVTTNGGAIAQILVNLVDNILFHAYGLDEPGVALIKAYDNGSTFVIEVIDYGKGMSKEVRQRAFEPFFTTIYDKGGSGLGLSIVYSLVTEKLKGTIELFSEEGKGTKVIIEIPKINNKE